MTKRFLSTVILNLVLLAGTPSLYALTGAIFTTVSDGTIVNANQYDSKCAVYLDGGPGPNAPAKAAGLPDGDYYFQVTDPSGKTLLSTDVVINRRFHVTGGVIVSYTGVTGPVHPTGTDKDHPELGAITIRLANATCPTDYLDSPNGGGVYKVWVTQVADFVGDPTKVDNDCGNGCYHGFVPSKTKTDNFKAKTGTVTFCLTVQKVLPDGMGGFIPKENWKMSVTDPLSVTNAFYTDVNGFVKVCGLGPGAYTVAEDTSDPNYFIVALFVNTTQLPTHPIYSFTWASGNPDPVIIFENTLSPL